MFVFSIAGAVGSVDKIRWSPRHRRNGKFRQSPKRDRKQIRTNPSGSKPYSPTRRSARNHVILWRPSLTTTCPENPSRSPLIAVLILNEQTSNVYQNVIYNMKLFIGWFHLSLWFIVSSLVDNRLWSTWDLVNSSCYKKYIFLIIHVRPLASVWYWSVSV